MKKTYKKPQVMVAVIENEMILAGSGGGVANGGAPGKEYNESDVSYSKQGNIDWDE